MPKNTAPKITKPKTPTPAQAAKRGNPRTTVMGTVAAFGTFVVATCPNAKGQALGQILIAVGTLGVGLFARDAATPSAALPPKPPETPS